MKGIKKSLGHKEKIVTEENNMLDIKKMFEGKRFTFLKQRLEYNNVCRELHNDATTFTIAQKKNLLIFSK